MAGPSVAHRLFESQVHARRHGVWRGRLRRLLPDGALPTASLPRLVAVATRSVVSSIGIVIALIGVFVFLPIMTILTSALQDNAGRFAPTHLWASFSIARSGDWIASLQPALRRCLEYALLALLSVSARPLSGWRSRYCMRTIFASSALCVFSRCYRSPPPAVRDRLRSFFCSDARRTCRSPVRVVRRAAHARISACRAIFIASWLASRHCFSGADRGRAGISPSLEEAAQTLRRKTGHVSAISLPLMRPGLANAFCSAS